MSMPDGLYYWFEKPGKKKLAYAHDLATRNAQRRLHWAGYGIPQIVSSWDNENLTAHLWRLNLQMASLQRSKKL